MNSTHWWTNQWFQAGLILASSLVLAFLVNQLIKRVLFRLLAKTKTTLDDAIAAITRRPIYVTILMVGLYWACFSLELSSSLTYVISGLTKSVVVFIWSLALSRITNLLLTWVACQEERFQLVQSRTLPIFEIVAKTVIAGGAVYLIFLSWRIDVTGWLASAGVIGIAVGFAAKDTLANLFSGVFILADAPYKIGDFIVMPTGERGKVTDIGIRSTRILTRDDIEIIIPNAVIANSKIVNESGGRHVKRRVSCIVWVAYGSDVEQVRSILMQVSKEVKYITNHPVPRVRFREMGDSGLKFELLCWVKDPVLKGRATDALNTLAYNKLNAAGIEIPYPKQDVYIKNVPPSSPSPPSETV